MEIEVTQAGGSAPIQILKDGSAVTVTKDTVTPSNTIPIPVEVVAASGSPINITAGDLNVQLSHSSATPDSVRVGDGTTTATVNVNGGLNTNVLTSALPSGASTSAKQDTGNTSLSSIDGKLPVSLGQKASAGSISVVVSNDQPIQTVNIQSSYATPSGTISAAGDIFGAQDSKEYSVVSFEVSGTFVATTRVKVSIDNVNYYFAKIYSTDGSAPVDSVTAPGLYYFIPNGRFYVPTVTAYTSGAVSFKTLAQSIYRGSTLAGGASTAANQVTAQTSLTNIEALLNGKAAVTKVRNVYSTTSVTTAAYVQLVASLASAVTEIEIFDSSGETLILAVGAAAAEVDQVYIIPGGNGRIPLAIASGARVSIKAASANATVGEVIINFYGV